MSWTLVTSAKVSGASGGTTSSVNTTGATLIVIEAGFSGAVTISDSKGNTWTAGTLYNGATPNTRFYYCISPTVGTGHTFTISASVSSMVVSAFSSTQTPLLDSQSTPNQTSGTQGQFGAASFTPTTDGCLLLAGVSWPATTSGFTAGSGWTAVDVNYYVGGTNYGSGVTYKTQTTATAVPTTEATSTWTSSTSASYHGIAFAETATSSLTITTPKQYEVHQRSGSTGSIQISGTVAGAAEDIEASFNGGAYQTIATSVAAGSFSGTLTGQSQGQGTLTVRKKVTTTSSATVANVGIGDVFVVGGDSISEGRGNNAQSYTHATLKATAFRQDDAWVNANDPIDTGTSVGSHWPLLATQIMASQGVPVAFISTGTGGTDMAGSNNTWAKPGTEYSGMTGQVTDSTVASVKAVLMHLGPNAVVNASTLSKATYNAAIDTLASNIAADVAGAPKLHLGIFGEVSTGSPPDRASALNNLRGAIIEALGDNTSVKPGPCLIDLDYSDGVHPKTDAELAKLAQRWWLALEATYYGGSHGRGPRVSSAMWNGARTQLTVTFDQALKTGLTHATGCWSVSDNGSAMTVSSVAYHGTNTAALVITTSAAAVGAAGTTTITFGNADSAIGLVVPLSADITLPAGGTTNQPAEPFYSYTVSEVDVTGPTLTSPSGSSAGATSATGSVSTNEATGTLYYMATTSASELAATLKASGSSKAVTATGGQSVSFSGLTASTTYYAHYLHTDAAGNDSTVSTSSSFTTSAAAAPTSGGGAARVALRANGELIVLLP